MQESVKIAPSVLSADFAHLAADLVDVASADFLHYDVMDGHFVPNLSFGIDILRTVRATSNLPVDVHLMITNPDEMVERYLKAGADLVSFHIEAATHAHRLVSQIHEHGAMAAIALNPATPVSALDAILEDLDMVLIMSVNPGFGGQRFIEGTLRKLVQLRQMCQALGVSPMIEVDGGITTKNAAEVVAAGANVLVAGSAIFGASDRGRAIEEMRAAGTSGLSERR